MLRIIFLFPLKIWPFVTVVSCIVIKLKVQELIYKVIMFSVQLRNSTTQQLFMSESTRSPVGIIFRWLQHDTCKGEWTLQACAQCAGCAIPLDDHLFKDYHSKYKLK